MFHVRLSYVMRAMSLSSFDGKPVASSRASVASVNVRSRRIFRWPLFYPIRHTRSAWRRLAAKRSRDFKRAAAQIISQSLLFEQRDNCFLSFLPSFFFPPTVVSSLALPIIRRFPDTSRAARLDPLRLRGGDTINRADESRTRIGIHEESRRVTNSRSATGRGFPPFIPPVGPSILQVFIARLGFPRDLKSLAQQERNNHSRFYDGGHEDGRRTAIKIAHETEGVSVLPTRTLVFAHYLDTPSLSLPFPASSPDSSFSLRSCVQIL